RSPLPLREIRAPAPPVCRSRLRLRQPSLLRVHDDAPCLDLGKVRDLTEDLDGALCRGERLEELPEALEPPDGVRGKPAKPPGIFGLRLSHVSDAQLEVLAIGVDGADHDLVAEDELEIQPVGRNLDLAVAAGDAGQHEDTVLAERLHAVEDHWGVAGGLEDE